MPDVPSKPTDSEVEILGYLWEFGPSTVRELHTRMSENRDIGYTTVLKLMQIMTDKGLLVRDERQRSHIYRPKQRAEATQRLILRDLLNRAFAGSTENLVLQVLSSKKATPEEIDRIRKLLDEYEGERG